MITANLVLQNLNGSVYNLSEPYKYGNQETSNLVIQHRKGMVKPDPEKYPMIATLINQLVSDDIGLNDYYIILPCNAVGGEHGHEPLGKIAIINDAKETDALEILGIIFGQDLRVKNHATKLFEREHNKYEKFDNLRGDRVVYELDIPVTYEKGDKTLYTYNVAVMRYNPSEDAENPLVKIIQLLKSDTQVDEMVEVFPCDEDGHVFQCKIDLLETGVDVMHPCFLTTTNQKCNDRHAKQGTKSDAYMLNTYDIYV